MTTFEIAPTRRRFLVGAGALSAAPLLAHVARADAPFPNLVNRNVTMIIGADVGGGYDIFGRAFGRYLEELVPGLRVSIQNIAKAGGKLAAKTLQEGPKDGSVFGMLPVSLMSAQVLQEEGVAYDVRSWSWIGKMAAEARLYTVGKAADFDTIEELRERGSIATMAVRSNSSFAYYEALWINAMLGIHVKPVPGYKSGEKEQAMVSGEVMMVSANYPDDMPLLKSPGTRVVLRVNSVPVPAPIDQVPTLRGLLGENTRHAAILDFLEANYELARWIVAPPALEPAVLADLRAAFDASVISPKFIADSAKLSLALSPMKGVELAGRIDGIMAKQDALRTELRATLECGKAMAEGAAGCERS